MRRMLTGMACLLALSGCAQIEKQLLALEEMPYDERIRQFPNESVFLPEPRYRLVPDDQDPIFMVNPYKVQRPRLDEEKSPAATPTSAEIRRFISTTCRQSIAAVEGRTATRLESARATGRGGSVSARHFSRAARQDAVTTS